MSQRNDTFYRLSSMILLGALTDILNAARKHADEHPPLEAEIFATMKRIETMSNSHYAALNTAISKVSDEVVGLGSRFDTAVANIKAQIAAGQTPDFTEVDAAAAAIGKVGDAVAAISAKVEAADPGSTVAVVFNAADTTPNSAGGRNSSHLSGFDPSVPETA